MGDINITDQTLGPHIRAFITFLDWPTSTLSRRIASQAADELEDGLSGFQDTLVLNSASGHVLLW
ncbi:hypothetical protein PIIN_08580 [Serendipita indica DSM 11827]|uniref:Uncharacterized protein n=1 Tax=Serendipita indica (strain DSM 11827) TaxID=1109443 RepID=G4TTI5_SERID|nr:hypothetical protein PIIN_08580 [Serendipita indica DSM 11827]